MKNKKNQGKRQQKRRTVTGRLKVFADGERGRESDKKYAAVIIGEGGPYNKKKEKRTKAGAFDKKRQNSSRPPIFRLPEFVSIEVSNENNLF